MTGYHIRDIPRGTCGESSKILEEVLELQDAEEQGIKIMQLCELADILRAIEMYIEKYFPGTSMEDLKKMADVTARAFAEGSRVDKHSLKP